MTTPWQTGHSDVKSRLNYLFETKWQSDCSFLVGEGNGQVVEAHKVIVAVASAVLQAKLKTAPGDKPRVTISNVEPEIFELMLKYIYTDSVAIGPSEVAFKLACAAGTYELIYLKKECFKFIAANTNITPQNVLRTYDLASCYKDSDLFRKCEEIIKTKTKEVLEDKSFLDSYMNIVSAVFAMEPLAINSELVLLKAADRYHKHLVEKEKTDNKCSEEILFQEVLSKIRFLTLTPQEFAEARASSSLLAETDACAVLANIASDKCGVPMPEGFSVSRKARNMDSQLDWACSAEVQVSFLDLKLPSRTLTETFSNFPSRDHSSWGFTGFKYEDLVGPDNKNLQNGVMVLEVSIKAEKPTFKKAEN